MEDKKVYLPYFLEETIYKVREGSATVQESSSSIEQAEEVHQQPTSIATSVNAEPVAVKPIVTFGENLKHCIVLFSSEHKISVASKDLLFKILASINRTPKDALMANVYDCSQEQIEALLSEHNHKHLISFDVKQTTELSQADPYTPYSSKGKHYILSDDLEVVATDIDKKKALWKALKEVFH